MKVILASTLPRRAELLQSRGIRFEVIAPDVEEGADPSANALAKARAVGKRSLPVIAADTIVFLDGEPIGKPASFDDALAMMRRLQGRSHEVTTGVAILHRGRERAFAVTSRVTFPRMTDEQIREYHARVYPLDKAGSYGIPVPGARIEGSESNVAGLPMEALMAELDALVECPP